MKGTSKSDLLHENVLVQSDKRKLFEMSQICVHVKYHVRIAAFHKF